MKAIVLILALALAHAPPSDVERAACKPDALNSVSATRSS